MLEQVKKAILEEVKDFTIREDGIDFENLSDVEITQSGKKFIIHGYMDGIMCGPRNGVDDWEEHHVNAEVALEVETWVEDGEILVDIISEEIIEMRVN